MPTVIDSLFLELGVDTSRFSKDQRAALEKIQQFEAQTKRASGKAAGSVKTVGDAFRDLAKDSRVGSSAAGIDNLATKLKNLGVSMQVSGGLGAPLGGMARGLGMLLSPAALGAAAVGLLGKEMWDLNKQMTEVNSTIDRQAMLSDMNAKSLWSWGEAARTVGANPKDVTGGISSVQTAIAGMMIGAADATPQLRALTMLGVGWDAESGMTDDQVAKLFETVHQRAKAKGYKNLGALRALTGPVMNDAMFDIATNPNYDPSQFKKEIDKSAPPDLNAILQKSLKSQMALGKLDIDKDILTETAYGGEQGLIMSVVEILRTMLGYVQRIADFLTPLKKVAGSSLSVAKEGPKTAFNIATEGAKAAFGAVANTLRVLSPIQFGDSAMRSGMSKAMQLLMGRGMSKSDAAAMVGNMAQESSMDPFARNGSHIGLMQWDKARQADFAKRYGYQIGSSAVSKDKQFNDQVFFGWDELQTTQKAAASAMAKVQDLMAKTKAFMDLDERPGDNSLSKRLANAVLASRLNDVAGMMQAANARSTTVQHSVTSETHIGDVILNTNATDPASHAAAFRDGISNQPLVDPSALVALSLSTRGVAL